MREARSLSVFEKDRTGLMKRGKPTTPSRKVPPLSGIVIKKFWFTFQRIVKTPTTKTMAHSAKSFVLSGRLFIFLNTKIRCSEDSERNLCKTFFIRDSLSRVYM